jgi:hypothetical protein
MTEKQNFRVESYYVKADLMDLRHMKAIMEKRAGAIKSLAKKIDPETVYKEFESGEMDAEKLDGVLHLICRQFNDCTNCPIWVHCRKKYRLVELCAGKEELHAKTGICHFCPRLRKCLNEGRIRLTGREE